MPGLPSLGPCVRGMAFGLAAVGSERSKLVSGVLSLVMSRFPLKPLLGIALLLTAAMVSLKQQDTARFSPIADQAQPTIGQSSLKHSSSLMPIRHFGAKQVLEQLAIADRQWIPKAELLPNGSTRYSYNRRAGEQRLTIEQIKDLIVNPPTFTSERQSISTIWQILERAGVEIRLSQPRKLGAAGEWDPKVKTLRIEPGVLDKGSKEFARVLNHEAIHVAQSCKGGSLTANSEVIGLQQNLPPELEFVLQKPQYRNTSLQAKSLEREAFANQADLDLGSSLVNAYCF